MRVYRGIGRPVAGIEPQFLPVLVQVFRVALNKIRGLYAPCAGQVSDFLSVRTARRRKLVVEGDNACNPRQFAVDIAVELKHIVCPIRTELVFRLVVRQRIHLAVKVRFCKLCKCFLEIFVEIMLFILLECIVQVFVTAFRANIA